MINGKSVLAITLARGGSKGIPKKNIIDINGKPLLQYTVDEVKKSGYIDNYIVSTDDKTIHDICSKLNVNSFNRKPVSDTQSSADGLLEVIKHQDLKYDYVIDIMCTNPFKTIHDIDGVIEKLDKTKADSVVSVVRIWDNHPSRVKYIEGDKLKDFYPEVPESRRQDLTPPAYVRNGSIYAMKFEQINLHKTRLGKDTRAYIMSNENTINIDEQRDLELARILMK